MSKTVFKAKAKTALLPQTGKPKYVPGPPSTKVKEKPLAKILHPRLDIEIVIEIKGSPTGIKVAEITLEHGSTSLTSEKKQTIRNWTSEAVRKLVQAAEMPESEKQNA